MRYTSPARIARRIPRQTLVWLSNDDPEAEDLDEAVVEQIAESNEDLIDDHLRGRYVLPLAEVPTTVADIADRLVQHDLYARRPETEIPKDVVRLHQNALQTLAAIRDGKLTLGIVATQARQPEPGGFKVRAPARALGDDALGQY